MSKPETLSDFADERSRYLKTAIKNSTHDPLGRKRDLAPDAPRIKPFKGYQPITPKPQKEE